MALTLAFSMPVMAYYVSPVTETPTARPPLEVVPLFRTKWAIEHAIECLKPNNIPRLEAVISGALYIPGVAMVELERFCENEHDWIQQHRTRRAADRLEAMLRCYHARASRVLNATAIAVRTVHRHTCHVIHRTTTNCTDDVKVERMSFASNMAPRRPVLWYHIILFQHKRNERDQRRKSSLCRCVFTFFCACGLVCLSWRQVVSMSLQA